MKRAYPVHFLSILTDEWLAIRASLTMKEHIYSKGNHLEKFTPSFPIQAYRLLNAYQFIMKIIIKNEDQEVIFEKVYESDSFGTFQLKIPLNENMKEDGAVHIIEAYEIGKIKALEVLLGTYLPVNLKNEKKFIICDFDKTLVHTKYSSPEEIYKSLTSPINEFPIIPESIEILNKYCDQGYHPFILSASPHFYENAIRDWLYANNIFSAGIFLKDYRKVFSFFESDLSPKDLKAQGLYKLNHLLDIVYMTGVPEELVLMGDNFESDPLIYLTFYELFHGESEPTQIWKKLKVSEAFRLNHKQNSLLLNKIFQLTDNIKRVHKKPKIKIYIRKKADEAQIDLPDNFQYGADAIDLYKSHVLDIKRDTKKITAQAPTE